MLSSMKTESHTKEFGWISGTVALNQILKYFVLFRLREAMIKSACPTSVDKRPCWAFNWWGSMIFSNRYQS